MRIQRNQSTQISSHFHRFVGAVILVTCIVLLGAPSTFATVRIDDWALELVERVDPKGPGEPTRVILDLFSLSHVDAQILGVSAEPGWKQLRHEFLPVDAAEKTGPGVRRRRFEITGLLEDAKVPLQLHLRVDGQEFIEELDFSRPPEGVAAIRVPDTRVMVPQSTLQRLGGPETVVVYEQPEFATAKRKDTTIRVRGVIAFRRADGTMLGADRVLVKIHDDEGGYNNGLVEGYTDATGGFDLSFSWNYGVLIDPEPDLVVSVESGNDHIDIRSTSIVSGNYSFEVWRQHDYVGPPDINLGTVIPRNPAMHSVLYLHTLMERSNSWFHFEGYDMPHTLTRWPADASFFRPLTSVIFIEEGDEWIEGVMVHEYTHRFIHHFGEQDDPEYCNGFCSDTPDDCQHCLWCQETVGTTWSEGIGDFTGEWLPRQFVTDYGVPIGIVGGYNFESNRTCTELPGGPAIDDPQLTEGLFAALCLDLVDGQQDNDLAFTSSLRDATQFDPELILDVAYIYKPRYAQTFLSSLQSHMEASPEYTSQDIEDLWETARNNGYEIDAAVPLTVTNLNSNTHTAGVSSPANIPQFYWTVASDDASGIQGYSVSMTAGAPALPDPTLDIGDVISYAFPVPLPPGSYWFNVRALDRAGNWSPSFLMFGPVVIGPAQPANLAPSTPEFWADPLVCLPSGVGSLGFVPDPTVLNGWVDNTVAFFAYKNLSVSSTSHDGWKTRLQFDGGGTSRGVDVAPGILLASQDFAVNLNIPFTVPGGRHTAVLHIDKYQELAESEEEDNLYARQFVWTPMTLAAGAPHSVSSLRTREGGWAGLNEAGWFNANGYRFDSSGTSYWHAAVVTPALDRWDVDVRIHSTLSTGALDGFTVNQGFSARPAGQVDAVIANRNTMGSIEYDVGVLSGSSTSYFVGYTVRLFESVEVAYESELTIAFESGEPLALREVNVGAPELGLFSAIVEVPDASEPVYVGWLDKDFTTGALHDLTQLVETDENGVAQLDVNVTETGYYCIVIYREPYFLSSTKAETALSVQMRTGSTPPNLRAFTTVAGWDGPLIPRSAADGIPTSVPEPTLLIGDVTSTWLNVAVYNDGLADSPASSAAVRIDGQTVASVGVPSLFPFLNYLYNDPSAISVRGGRHLLSIHVDDTDSINETIESDNYFADQWVWEPVVLPVGSSVVRGSPPAQDGGFDDIVYEFTLNSESAEGADLTIFPEVYPNCDGLRMPLPSPAADEGHWLAVASMPGPKTDVNLRLHELSTGARDGFTDALAGSFEGESTSDYVLVNFREEASRQFDVGILRAGNGISSFLAETVSSTSLGPSPEGNHGPFALDPQEILNLHEVWLSAGRWIIQLSNLNGVIDYGLALHGGAPNAEGTSFFGPNDTPEGGASVVEGPGQDETLQVDLSMGMEGYYVIAVRKMTDSDLGQSGSYKLDLLRTTTDAPSTPLAFNGERLRAIHPNPFNPRTTVVFELPQTERVVLEVYDIRGRKVRQLLNELRPLGRHELVFDGVDDQGQTLASGTYFVRLSTQAGTEVRKASLIK